MSSPPQNGVSWTRRPGFTVQGVLHCQPYLTQSVFKVVLHKSIPTQIRGLILYFCNITGYVDEFVWQLTSAKRFQKHLLIFKDNLTDFCGSWLLQNDFENTLCEIKPEHYTSVNCPCQPEPCVKCLLPWQVQLNDSATYYRGSASSRFKNNCFAVMRSGSEEGSYSRHVDVCITQL